MQQILALYPAPNGQILDGARGILHFPSHSLANGNSITGRIDHDFQAAAFSPCATRTTSIPITIIATRIFSLDWEVLPLINTTTMSPLD